MLYESLLITKEWDPSFTHPKARYELSGISYPPPRNLFSLSGRPRRSTHTTNFVFFFPDWVDRIPISISIDDLENIIEPLMKFVGLHISWDPLFLTKLHLQPTVTVDPDLKKPTGEPDPDHPVRQF